jgi:hypothetical protein
MKKKKNSGLLLKKKMKENDSGLGGGTYAESGRRLSLTRRLFLPAS